MYFNYIWNINCKCYFKCLLRKEVDCFMGSICLFRRVRIIFLKEEVFIILRMMKMELRKGSDG